MTRLLVPLMVAVSMRLGPAGPYGSRVPFHLQILSMTPRVQAKVELGGQRAVGFKNIEGVLPFAAARASACDAGKTKALQPPGRKHRRFAPPVGLLPVCCVRCAAGVVVCAWRG